ncbi:hypothetical protein CF166_29540 [Amycolatopsis sp. KNN50.9b]|nr:hypothetical protein CF166_29540 [Amycolatopsis sp. KNN50.9b]
MGQGGRAAGVGDPERLPPVQRGGQFPEQPLAQFVRTAGRRGGVQLSGVPGSPGQPGELGDGRRIGPELVDDDRLPRRAVEADAA